MGLRSSAFRNVMNASLAARSLPWTRKTRRRPVPPGLAIRASCRIWSLLASRPGYDKPDARPVREREREVARGGVEPPTFRFSVGRSYQLSYLAEGPGVTPAQRGPDGI